MDPRFSIRFDPRNLWKRSQLIFIIMIECIIFNRFFVVCDSDVSIRSLKHNFQSVWLKNVICDIEYNILDWSSFGKSEAFQRSINSISRGNLRLIYHWAVILWSILAARLMPRDNCKKEILEILEGRSSIFFDLGDRYFLWAELSGIRTFKIVLNPYI